MRLIICMVGFVFFAGCSQTSYNQIEITNNSLGKILLNFRGEVTPVSVGNRVQIINIPNGDYEYSTTYTLPQLPIKSTDTTGGASGVLSFNFNNTKIAIAYSGAVLDSVYSFGATVSSNNQTTSPTAP